MRMRQDLWVKNFFFVGEQQLCLHMAEVLLLGGFCSRDGSERKSDVQRPLETARLNYM